MSLRVWMGVFVPYRYVPVVDDVVVGVVASRHAENYKVDVGTSSLVQLDALAFDGASKRNKPNLQVGDVVYARVVLVRSWLLAAMGWLIIFLAWHGLEMS